MKKETLALIMDYSPNSLGGIQTNTVELKKALEKEGLVVSLLTPENISSHKELENAIKKADKIHIQLAMSLRPLAMAAIELCTKSKRNCLVMIHSQIIRTKTNRLAKMVKFEKDVLLTKLKKFAKSECVQFVAPTEVVAKELSSLLSPSKQPIVIPYGINSKIIPDKDKKPSTDLISVGALKHFKGIQFLIQALSLLKEQGLNLNLLVVGEGDFKNDLESLVTLLQLEEQVCFTGKLARGQVLEELTKAKIFVNPSLTESFSIALLEALAIGVPAIATNTGGMAEVLENGNNGKLFKPADASDLAEKIKDVFNNYPEVLEISKKTMKKVRKLYSLENQVKTLNNLYRKQ